MGIPQRRLFVSGQGFRSRPSRAGNARGFCQGRREALPTSAANDKIRVRVGTPLVARGPAGDIADNWFTEIQLPDKRFRGFTAAGVTWAVDGKEPYDMSAPAPAVLKPGPPGSPSSC